MASIFHLQNLRPAGRRSHEFAKTIPLAAKNGDGNDATQQPLGFRFSHGMRLAMSGDRGFLSYGWDAVRKRLGEWGHQCPGRSGESF